MNKSEEQIRKKSPVQIKNKKASFEYFFIETFTAGIVPGKDVELEVLRRHLPTGVYELEREVKSEK